MNKLTDRVLIKLAIFTCFAFGALTVAAQDAPKCSEPNGLKSSEIKDLIKAHNNARDGADLVWDCGVAAQAQASADSAASGSSTSPAPGESRLSSFDSSLNTKEAFDLWREQKRDWDAKAGTCETGRVCNQWAQIVNPSATKFGCGINRKGTGRVKAVLVCRYDPARL